MLFHYRIVDGVRSFEAGGAMGALEVYGLVAGYAGADVLRGVGLGVGAGECAAVVGPAGAGKTTLLRAVSGLLAPSYGRVLLDGADVTGWPPERIAAAGLAHVPEGQRIFAGLSVAENLALGAWTRRRGDAAADRDRVLGLFPRLRDRMGASGDDLTAADRHLLAIARGLMAAPSVLLLDGPFGELDAATAAEVGAALRRVRAAGGPAMLLAERSPRVVRAVADRVYVLEGGALRAAP
jgi:branched-chain amino acid transport system ATP-binding protein